jgi:phosphoribosylformylglycinamidine synthase
MNIRRAGDQRPEVAAIRDGLEGANRLPDRAPRGSAQRWCQAVGADRFFSVPQTLRKHLMKARIIVTLKTGVLDPQGKAIEGALKSLSVDGVSEVRQGKVFDVELADADRDTAQATLKVACEKLLANTVIENYRIELV